jgi:hypothetical protein
MSRKRKTKALALAFAVSLLSLVVLYLVNLDPSMVAATSGWYGYNNQPVCPEPTALETASSLVPQRNNAVVAGNGDTVQYLEGVLKFTGDGISCAGPGLSFSHRPTINNNHFWGAGEDDGNMAPTGSPGFNNHTGFPQLVVSSAMNKRIYLAVSA